VAVAAWPCEVATATALAAPGAAVDASASTPAPPGGSGEGDELLRGLRELAEFLAAHPQVPVPQIRAGHCGRGADDEAKMADVEPPGEPRLSRSFVVLRENYPPELPVSQAREEPRASSRP